MAASSTVEREGFPPGLSAGGAPQETRAEAMHELTVLSEVLEAVLDRLLWLCCPGTLVELVGRHDSTRGAEVGDRPAG